MNDELLALADERAALSADLEKVQTELDQAELRIKELESRLAAQSPEPVAVETLAWTQTWDAPDGQKVWCADPANGALEFTYSIWLSVDGRYHVPKLLEGYFGSLAAAKSAAQADYEQRIRSALVNAPVSASDGAMREALEQIRTVCIDNAGDTVRHDLAIKFIGKIASRVLAASEATKSDGGEERTASNPLSEVTHRPSDPHEPATVLTKGGEGPAYIGRPGDAHNLYEDSARDTRPAEVTVEVRALIAFVQSVFDFYNEGHSMPMWIGRDARALLDTYKIGAK